jgi:hypothetical protein
MVAVHAALFRDLFDNQGPFWHCQANTSGRIVFHYQSVANIARCILESADKAPGSRCRSEASWWEDAVNRRRRFMIRQTKPHWRRLRESTASWMLPWPNMGKASFTMWTAAIATVMAPSPWPITPLPSGL